MTAQFIKNFRIKQRPSLHLYLNMLKYKYKCKEVIKCKKK